MEGDAIDLIQRGIAMAMILAGPLLAASAIVGIVIAVLQAVTQIQDQTVAFVCKYLAAAVAFAILLPWLLERIIDFSRELWSSSVWF